MNTKTLTAAFAALAMIVPSGARAAFAPENTNTVTFVGRTLEYYHHGSDPAWGAKNPNQEDAFAVLFPKDGARGNAPLYVVLHSAGHSLQTCLDCVPKRHNHDIYTPPDDFYALFVDCRANSKTDWWWGQSGVGLAETPVEKRIIATVKWTVEKYGIDPNRVYLVGNSMGGSGTLGIGLRHGDVFAALKANVPAGVIHVSNRLGFVGAPTNEVERAAFDKAVASIPDPPVLVDYSAPNDQWSKGHEAFYADMAKRRYAILGFWGNFGHENVDVAIARRNDIIHAFAWTNLVRNAAYPVFTGASCDSAIDFKFGAGGTKEPGQVNGFFRWRNVSDAPDAVALELRLDSRRTKVEVLYASDDGNGRRRNSPFAELHCPARRQGEVDVRRPERRGDHWCRRAACRWKADNLRRAHRADGDEVRRRGQPLLKPENGYSALRFAKRPLESAAPTRRRTSPGMRKIW